MIFAPHSPFCTHFGSCGGCTYQNLPEEAYRTFKENETREKLLQRRLLTPNTPFSFIDGHGLGRRRLVLHARWEKEGVIVGFMAAQSHTLVSIQNCPVTTAALCDLPKKIAHLLTVSLRKRPALDVHLTALEEGILCGFKGNGPCTPQETKNLIDHSKNMGFAAIFWNGALLAQFIPPRLHLGKATVTPPPHVFLQATVLGETLLTSFAEENLKGTKKIADLFCGIGPFALRLAEKREVFAYDIEEASLEALACATKTLKLKKISTTKRDLFRMPLSAQELKAFDGLVIDPPSQGAFLQTKQIAKSLVPNVVMISCNLDTFCRDAHTLLEGGYRLKRLLGIDQFKWTPHIELAAWFVRI